MREDHDTTSLPPEVSTDELDETLARLQQAVRALGLNPRIDVSMIVMLDGDVRGLDNPCCRACAMQTLIEAMMVMAANDESAARCPRQAPAEDAICH